MNGQIETINKERGDKRRRRIVGTLDTMINKETGRTNGGGGAEWKGIKHDKRMVIEKWKIRANGRRKEEE